MTQRSLPQGMLILDPKRREVKLDNKSVPLTFLQFELVRFLLEKKGFPQSRETLLTSVWKIDKHATGIYVESRTVDNAMSRIKKKIGDGVIVTVPMVGYKIVSGRLV